MTAIYDIEWMRKMASDISQTSDYTNLTYVRAACCVYIVANTRAGTYFIFGLRLGWLTILNFTNRNIIEVNGNVDIDFSEE